jgi:hypothetical protein
MLLKIIIGIIDINLSYLRAKDKISNWISF